ncbi:MULTISPECIES: dual specificity protein phosphatase family protein [Pseudovibrio]|uniref:dual specificity protein phosphatase family protein n=1 Tax=Stappiaceae TaxID=2821832 RepID=UPI00236733A2|nr:MULTISPECIES: dual specificity protein phosphatase [Pseudovibrio]MDD7911646.1 dual specificity protein phosphatase [Pseudovibrio exalbescens]MDX5594382.1 dual specificity protein phosphatase [Pseudovibrio sp. SPO723]
MSDNSLTTPLSDEKKEDLTPVAIPVYHLKGYPAISLFIGNKVAASDPELLMREGITSTMNFAVNVEMLPLTLPNGVAVRRTHIGLIDGNGNTAHHLLSGVFALAGVIGQASPGKDHYPPHRQGNVLIHCRGGRSRSATVLALYLHLCQASEFPSFEVALEHVRACRGLDQTYPLRPMIDLAHTALELLPAREMFCCPELRD